MENKIGFFEQIKYLIKGIAKPRYFNRLSGQSKGCLVGYIIIITIISTAAFWGMKYVGMILPGGLLTQMNKYITDLPSFMYENGTLSCSEYLIRKSDDEKDSFVIDTSIAKPDKAYYDQLGIETEWVIGGRVLVLNGQSATYISEPGTKTELEYKNILEKAGFPASFDNASLAASSHDIFLKLYLIFAAASILFFIIKAVATGFLFSAAGVLIVKITKAQYSYSELVNMSFFITGLTTVLKRVIMGSPLDISRVVVDIIMVLIVCAYMFFAIIGAQEETGPASTVYFDKPSKKSKFSDDDYHPGFTSSRAAGSAGAAGLYGYNTSSESQAEQQTQEVYIETSQQPEQQSVYDTSESDSYVRETVSIFDTQDDTVEQTYSDNAQVYTQQYEQPIYEESAVTDEQPVYEEVVTEYEQPQESAPQEYEAPTDALSFYESLSGEQQTNSSTENSSIQPIESTGGVIKSENTYGIKRSEDPEANPLLSKKIGFSGTGGAYAGRGGGYAGPSYDRPITAPDMGMGFSSYGSNYNTSLSDTGYSSGSLASNRGGFYGKTLTIGQAEKLMEKASVAAQNIGTSEGVVPPAAPLVSEPEKPKYSYGSSLYTRTLPASKPQETENVTFTSKWGGQPFSSSNSFESLDSKKSKKNAGPIKSYTKSGKAVNRYSDDDFAQWERENYAEEFKPRGGFAGR